ncbi:MAG: DHH family phosphoesterase [Lachnospiraceae bacterium]|nr:DHH family phosphoesterase [Lachnospiraceae bacterium]MDY5742918.1 DHH family phosphoesterase [Lachnospiraceae bacterium]
MQKKTILYLNRILILYFALSSIILTALSVLVFFEDTVLGMLMGGFAVFFILGFVLFLLTRKRTMERELISYATQFGQVQKKLLQELETPYTILDKRFHILWMNRLFQEMTNRRDQYRKSLFSVFTMIEPFDFRVGEQELTFEMEYGSRLYQVHVKRIYPEEIRLAEKEAEGEGAKDYLIAVYFFDQTDLHELKRINEEQQLVTGLLYIDNYEEALENVEEVRKSLLLALVDRKIDRYISHVNGLAKKLEKDKYILVMTKKQLAQLIEDRFSILADMKTINIGNRMPVTISMGISSQDGALLDSYKSSRVAIDLALGRGGDQVVIRQGDALMYFGGNTQKAEKNTRVKARVKAQALAEFISGKERVVVMGHKVPDVDSFGAAVGIYRAAKALGKKAYIVISEVTTSVRPLMDAFLEGIEDKEVCIDGNRAKSLVDDDSVLVVVDTSRPAYVDCPSLLELTGTIVILDHHRLAGDIIENAVLSYIEPFASSSCEMVAEILQYITAEVRIRNVEADCLYAGIIIDTNNFENKAGVRTFEAAAFLRRNGADVVRVRKLFREDFHSYRARAEAIRSAEMYQDSIAFSICPSENLESPTVICAQAANELLNIATVKASFVVTKHNGEIYISARSIDEMNVQSIMERLGGGGHLNMAGAQLTGVTEREAIDRIKEAMQEMDAQGLL